MQKITFRVLLFFSCLLIFQNKSKASHIVGGSLTYTASATVGTYTVTLKLYRVCTGAALASTATIRVNQANGANFPSSRDFTVTRTYTTSVTPVLPPCATAPASPPCVEEHVYQAVVTNLMPAPGGMHLSHQVCCRNAGITNLTAPSSDYGETFYAFIPGYFAGNWTEDFTGLTNGDISDAGATAWTRSVTSTPPASAQVNNEQFEVIGANGGTTNIWSETFTLPAATTIGAGTPPAWTRTVTGVTAQVNAGGTAFEVTGAVSGNMTLTTQTVDISAYPGGVNVGLTIEEFSNVELGDGYVAYYSINGGALVQFAAGTNEYGQDIISVSGLVGSNVKIVVYVYFDGTDAAEVVTIDNIAITTTASMMWYSEVIDISTYLSGVSLGVGLSEVDGANLEAGDNITVKYSLDGATPVNFTNSGSVSDDFAEEEGTGPNFAYANTSILTGSTVRVFIIVSFNGTSDAAEVYRWDMVSIYDAASFLTNSNPSYDELPPLLMCKTNDFSLDYSATDGDGDDLVYSLYTPYDNAPLAFHPEPHPAPTYTNNIAVFSPVPWDVGYSATTPFNDDGSGSVYISTTSGILTGVANTLGSFVFGVKVQEYRGGVYLGETTRGYQVTTVDCPPFVPATPTAASNSPICAGQTLSLSALSSDVGATYNWTGPNSYTTTVQNPTIPSATTAASGTYSVTGTVAGCTGPAGTTTVTVNSLPTAPTISSNSPVCAGNVLTLSASSMSGASYTWSGPNSFTSSSQYPTISAATTAATGTYSVYATVSSCGGAVRTASVTVNGLPAAPTASSNSPVCAGNTLTLTASTISGATYAWTGPNSFSSSLQNPTLPSSTTAASGTYSVTATVNGCPGPRGTVAVTITSLPAAPTASSNSPICAGNTLTLSASSISGATYSWTGPNSFTSSSQNPTISAATTAASGTYSVMATVSGCPGPIGTATITVNPIPGTPTASSNSPICAGSTLTLSASTISGATYSWTGPNSFTSSSQNPTISSATTAASGTYSVVGTVSGCGGTAGTVTVTVNPIPATPTATSNSPICAGSTLTLTASTISGASYAWSGPNSFTSSLQNPTISAATTAATGTYSVVATVSGCGGSAGTVSATVNPIPATPTVSGNSPICAGGTLTLSASTVSGASYSWTGPNSFASTSQNPTISAATTAATGTYSVIATVTGCGGSAGTFTATVNGIPLAPTASSNSPICAGSNLTLSASTISGATYAWTGPNSFTSASQNPTITSASVTSTGTYSVIATVNSCGGPAGTVAVTVSAIPTAPVAISNSPICAGTTLTLSASNMTGATYSWTGPNGFTSASQNPTITTPTTTATGTYSVIATVSGCGGAVGTVSVTVNPTPIAPTATSNSPICAGNTLTLTASAVTGATYAWTGPNAFTSASQKPTVSSATTAATGTYSVTATVSGCTGPAGTIAATVNPIPVAPTASSNSPICAGSNLTLSASTVSGATYSWTGPNSFTSASQNPTITSASVSATGTYSVIATVNSCGGPAGTVAVTVNAIPTAPVASSNSPICAGTTLTLSASNMTGATYAWSGPNGFTSASQNPTITTPTTTATGTYSVIATVSGCGGAVGTTSVTVNGIPIAPTASSNSPVCSGGNLTLSATTISGASYAWTGPNSFTSTSQYPVITSPTVTASGTYSVTATVNSCAGPAGTVAATVSSIPPAPTASSNSSICSGTTLTLSATTIPGATYAWTGPNSFTSASQYPSIISPTITASGTYSVTATVSGCVGPAGTTAVTVHATPVAPTASSNSPICDGSNLTLSASTISGATYSWSGPNGFTSASKNPTIFTATTTATGTYSVIATVNGCPGPAGTVAATVNGIPGAPNASSNSPVCAGTTLSLSASPVTGATYAWTGPNSFSSSLQNPTISAATTAATGTYSVSVSVSGCGGSFGTIAATVHPIPAAPTASNDSPICVSNTLNLTAGSISGATYSWTGPDSFTSSSQNPSIAGASVLASGTYSVTVTVNGCTGAAGITTATVNAVPTVSATNNGPVCVSSTLSFSATLITGASYSWTGPNGFTASTRTPSIPAATTAATGTYSVVTTVASCPSTLSTTDAFINPPPSAPGASNDSPICAGNTLSLSAGDYIGAVYSWSGPNGFTSSSQYPTISAATTAATGTYSVSITTPGCAGSAVSTTSVTVYGTPVAPTAGSNSPLCVANPLNLTASNISGATYAWTGPNSFTSSSQNPSIPSVTSAAAGTYSVTATVNGCTGPAGTTDVIINSNPPPINSNSPVCVGQSLTLTTTTVTGATYAWNGPNGFSSVSQNPVITNVTLPAAGTYSLVVTLGICVSPAGTAVVVVNPLPTTPTVSNDSPVCQGSTISFTSSSYSNATYSWIGPNSFTSASQNPTLPSATTLASGTYSLVVTETVNGCSSLAATTTATVFPTPVIPTASSNSPICAGNTLTLTASTVSGATYAWTGPDGFTSPSQNPTIPSATTLASGNYSVTATVNGCTGPAGTVSAVVNPIPLAPATSSNAPICSGNNLSLSAGAISGATYSWSGPNGFTSVSQNPTISAATTAATGNYSVTATAGGCPGPAGILSATVNAIPIAPTAGNNTPVCEGGNIDLTASNISGATYSWSGPNSFTSTSQNSTVFSVTPSAAGVYSVTATVNSCTGPAGITTATVNVIPTVAITHNAPICSGNTLTLTATTIANATYAWSGPNGFTSASQNPTIPAATSAATGTYSVTTTVASCPSSVSTSSVVVNSPPLVAPTVGNNGPLCEGEDLSLTASVPSGSTYSWTGPNSFTSSSQDPVLLSITTAEAGTYSVSAIVPGCPVSPVGTTTVVVNIAPGVLTPASNSTVCLTYSLSLSVNTIANALYSWSGPNGFTSVSQNPVVASTVLADAGTYSVTATTPGCPTSAVYTTEVAIETNPVVPTASSNAPVCAGSSLLLSASSIAGVNYSWTGPNGFTSGIQNPIIGSSVIANSGNYTVTASTLVCPASGIATTSVVVNAIPATPTASSNSPLCPGNSLSLSATTIGGAAYSWTGPNSFASVSQNPTVATVTSADAGTYSVTATVNGCTSGYGTTDVLINATPPPITSNSPVCVGNTLSLGTTAVTGATYAWTGPNGFTSASQNPAIVGVTSAAAGTYSLVVTLGICVSPAGTAVVVVNPIPTTPVISSNSPICAGLSLDFTADPISNATYSWIGVNGFSSSLQNPSISAATTAASGSYSLTVTETVNGCSSIAAISSATVNPIPATPVAGSNSPLCPAETLTLTASTISGATYSWTGPNSFVSVSQNPVIVSVVTADDGVYSVDATVNGCTSAIGTTTVIINSNPPAMSSNGPVCEGTTLLLSTPAVTGATYAWSGPNGFTSVSQDPSISNITLTAAGTYSLITTLGGCVSPSGTLTVFVNPRPATPTASEDSPVCQNSTLNLSTPNVAGVTYQWTGVNGFSSSLQNPSISGVTLAADGSYSVTITEQTNNCVSLPGITTATVIAIPATPTASSNSPLCPGETLNLTASTVAGTTYSWTGVSAFSSTDQNPSIVNVTGANAGTYSVTVIDVLTGCSSLPGSTSVLINVSPPVVSNNGPVCDGATLNLSTPAITGAIYAWTGPDGFSSGVQNPSIVGVTTAATGIYSLVVTVGTCISPAGTTTVTVNTVPAAPVASNNSPVCELADLDLTASDIPGATYQWTGVNGFTSTLQNPTITAITLAGAGSYSVTATFAGCPAGPAGVTSVLINAAPSMPTANNNGPLCPGENLDLAAAGIGPVSYQWTGVNGFSSSLQNPSIAAVTAANAGTYSVNVTNTTTGCTSLYGATSVVINANPPTVSSNSPVCESLALNLTTPTIAGATYSWTGPNGFSSAAQNPIINGVTLPAAGTYSLIVTLGTCVSPLGTTAVTINSIPLAPSATSNSPICSGNTLGLTAGTMAGVSYQWTGTNGFSSTLQNPFITAAPVLAAGDYSVTASVAGCPAGPAGITSVVINSTPSAPSVSSDSPLCPGETLNLEANTIFGVNYNWTGPNSFSSPLEDPSIVGLTGVEAGTYTLIVTDMVNGCGSSPSTTDVIINSNPPVVSNNGPVCITSTLNLSTTFAGATLYSWTGPDGFTSADQNPSIPAVTLAAAGTYSLVVTLGSCISPAGMTTAVISLPPSAPSVSNNGPVCEFTPLNITASTISGASYSWIGPNGFVSSSQNPVIASALTTDAGSYSVTATIAGCPATSPVATDAIVNPSPGVPVVSSNSPLCSSSTLDLTVNTVAGATYSWSGPNGFISSSQNPSIAGATFAEAGIYSVTITAASGCATSGEITVVIGTSTPIISSNAPVCEGDDLTISTDTIFGATYDWTGPDGFVSTQRTPSITGATILASGTYSVVITTGSCISETGTANISVNAIPTIPVLSSNSPVCEGDTLILSTFTVSGGSYSWTGPNGFTYLDADTAIGSATSAAQGTYSMTLSVGGCSSIPAIITTTVNLNPAAPALSSNGPVCEGSTLNLTASTVAGVSYNWAGPDNFVSSAEDTSISNVSLAGAGEYTLTVTDIVNGCSGALATTTVTVNPKPLADFVHVSSCGSDSVSFTDSSTTSLGAVNGWIWNFGEGNTSTQQSPSNIYPAFGTYSVTLIVTNDLTCSDTVAYEIITTGTPPVATFTTSTGATTYNVNETIDFLNTTSNAIAWIWNFGDGSPDSSEQNISYAYAQAGTYTVSLFVTNAGGCNDSTYLELTINVIDENYGPVAVPTGFTPNDDGNNDVLYVRGGPFVELEFKVYNEWGNLVFESKDQNIGWDGKKNGAKQPTGVYIYTLKGKTVVNEDINESRDVHLLR